MSNYKKKHKAPMKCRIRRKIMQRPSAFSYCKIGCYRKNHRCVNCAENLNEMIRDSFITGMKQCAQERRDGFY